MTKKIKVAIIEDDQMINQMYRVKFEMAGYEVAVAEDGKSGIELVKNMCPDIILLDLMMPGMNGDEALEHIRKMPGYDQTPVAILTNIGREEAPKRIHELGVSQFIVKADATPSQVVSMVESILKK
jgi:DNA-binding response OmpR family regulator